MESEVLLAQVTDRAKAWLNGNYDEQTKQEVKAMLESEDKKPLIDAF